MKFAKDRIALAKELLKDLADARGQGRRRARTPAAPSGSCFSSTATAATWSRKFVGGEAISRDHKADQNGRDPFVPVAGRQAARGLKFLAENILTDKPFQFSPSLLRQLAADRWMHWGNDSFSSFGPAIDISVLERILGIQKIVLSHCLNAQTLARLQNQQLQANPGADPLRMEEVFRALDRRDLVGPRQASRPKDAKDPKAAKVAFSTVRRNLQREYLRRLSSMVIGNQSNPYSDMYSYIIIIGGGNSSVPADARALARLHLKETAGRIGMVLETRSAGLDDTTRAHLEESKHRIAKVLEANLDIKEP